MVQVIDNSPVVKNNPDVFVWVPYEDVGYTSVNEDLQFVTVTEVSDFAQRKTLIDEHFDIVPAFNMQQAIDATLKYTRKIPDDTIDADLGSGL